MTAAPAGRVRARAAAVPERVMASHRRYTRANGDALAGSLAYALLVVDRAPTATSPTSTPRSEIDARP
ncbi:hypothetical protein ABZY57_09870 [Streptomyces sp. NPDC006450]|uniref:hypothetical protein n=1 Tax=Streptomyces sp. NPDC006450 TaxID=3155458 RepID=UPI0033B6425F